MKIATFLDTSKESVRQWCEGFVRIMDYTDNFSNFFEDLLTFDRFAESVPNKNSLI